MNEHPAPRMAFQNGFISASELLYCLRVDDPDRFVIYTGEDDDDDE